VRKNPIVRFHPPINLSVSERGALLLQIRHATIAMGAQHVASPPLRSITDATRTIVAKMTPLAFKRPCPDAMVENRLKALI
jgi:hypothetical protein